jgi:hypothetical protein
MGLTHLAARYSRRYRYTSYGYYPYLVPDTSPPVTSSISGSFSQRPARDSMHFACGAIAQVNGATTTEQLAQQPWAPTCPACAVIWDQTLERQES